MKGDRIKGGETNKGKGKSQENTKKGTKIGIKKGTEDRNKEKNRRQRNDVLISKKLLQYLGNKTICENCLFRILLY